MSTQVRPVPRTLGARVAAVVIALFASVVITACSSGVRPEAAPANPSAEGQPVYKIGPGDALNVFVFDHPELTLVVPVRPDGKVSTPLIEDMTAAGKTPSELARDMEKVLSEFVRTPKVNIIVTNFVGAYADQVRVVGQAAKPQALPYKSNMTLLDVMIQVGGLAEFAAGNRAKILRRQDGKATEIRVRLKDLLDKGDVKANITMLPGDVLVIPESRF